MREAIFGQRWCLLMALILWKATEGYLWLGGSVSSLLTPQVFPINSTGKSEHWRSLPPPGSQMDPVVQNGWDQLRRFHFYFQFCKPNWPPNL